jgi:hypothetical protein
MRAVAVVLVAACAGGGTPLLPEDYAATFTEVRDCRRSADHDLRHIRILADDDALGPYTERLTPFPPGAFIVKEEFDFADDACAGPLLEWTVMQRRTDATNLGWIWQRLAADRTVVTEDEDRCIGCHSDCGKPPDGYDSTCAVP